MRPKQFLVPQTRGLHKDSFFVVSIEFCNFLKRIRNLTKEAVSYLVDTKVAECGDMTIIDALLYVDELMEKEKRLYAMKTHQERERKNNPYRAEYEYINYDRKRIEEEYLKTKAELERMKMCVDFYIYELSNDYEKQSESL